MQLTIAHSPDPDDAFMVYGLKRGLVDTGMDLELVAKPIADLNEQAMRGAWQVTALSAHAYAHVQDRYRLLPVGSSVGRDYGPVLVSNGPLDLSDLAEARIAVPGQSTTAYLVAQIALGGFEPWIVPFKQIPQAVAEGAFDAGIVIHEGQLTFDADGLHAALDLGAWWRKETGLPLPLGVNAVARSLPDSIQASVARVFGDSVRYALGHRDAALDYAMTFGRGLSRDEVDRFVEMYVNDDTLTLEDDVVQGLNELYAKGNEIGVLDGTVDVDPVVVRA